MSRPWLFDGLDSAAEAGALCDGCPVASACLAEALRDHAEGTPLEGVRGGVWFTPGHAPRPVRHVEVLA